MNIFGALGRSKFKIPSYFQKRREKNKEKIKEKQEFLRKIDFSQKKILVFGVTLKQINVYT